MACNAGLRHNIVLRAFADRHLRGRLMKARYLGRSQNTSPLRPSRKHLDADDGAR